MNYQTTKYKSYESVKYPEGKFPDRHISFIDFRTFQT